MDKNLAKPLVTVFMAVFNGEPYIKKSIESVLNQTFTDFELLIINDGSTDRSVEMIKEFKDPRIRLLHNDGNKGLCYTRIRSLEEAWGTYLAVLDCDDLATSDRLQLQVNFMNTHPEIDLCGGQALMIDGKGNIQRQMNVPSGYLHMDILMIFSNIFINSTLMIKKEAMLKVGGYNSVLNIAGDYDLSFRISLKHKIANLDEVLVSYRVHGQNMSRIQEGKLKEEECAIIKTMHEALSIPHSDALVLLHHDLMYYPKKETPTLEYFKLLDALKQGNSISGIYPTKLFNQMIFNKWFALIKERREKKILSLYFKKPLFEWSIMTFKHLRKIFKQFISTRLSTK